MLLIWDEDFAEAITVTGKDAIGVPPSWYGFGTPEDFHDWFYDTFHDDVLQDQLELVERWLGLDE